MWKRSDLKRNAKTALKANYLKCMLAGIILLFAAGSQTIGGSSTSTVQDASDAYYQSLALMDGTQNSENPVLNDTLYLNTDGELTPDGYQAIYAQAEGLIPGSVTTHAATVCDGTDASNMGQYFRFSRWSGIPAAHASWPSGTGSHRYRRL